MIFTGSEPTLSVIIPVLNAAQKLAETLSSIPADQAKDMEIIVVDGGSTDGTLQVLKRHRSRVQFSSQPDKGIYDAYNKGFLMAKGRFVYFLGAGDRLSSQGLAAMWPHLLASRNQTRTLLYGNVDWRSKGWRYDGRFTKTKLTKRNICHQAVFYGREAFESHGPYDLTYKLWADYVLNIHCFADTRITKQYIDTVVAEYEGTGASSQTFDEAFLRDRRKLMRELGTAAYLVFLTDRIKERIGCGMSRQGKLQKECER